MILFGVVIVVVIIFSGWGYEYWGVVVFWVMVVMGGLVLLICVDILFLMV